MGSSWYSGFVPDFVEENLSDFGRSIDLTNSSSNLHRGTLAVTGTIYGLADAAAFGALPDVVAGVRIVPAGSAGYTPPSPGGESNIASDLLRNAGLLPAYATAGLPATGANLGAGLGSLLGNTLQGAGTGLGSGLLLPALVIGGVLVAVLLVVQRPQSAAVIRAARSS